MGGVVEGVKVRSNKSDSDDEQRKDVTTLVLKEECGVEWLAYAKVRQRAKCLSVCLSQGHRSGRTFVRWGWGRGQSRGGVWG